MRRQGTTTRQLSKSFEATAEAVEAQAARVFLEAAGASLHSGKSAVPLSQSIRFAESGGCSLCEMVLGKFVAQLHCRLEESFQGLGATPRQR